MSGNYHNPVANFGEPPPADYQCPFLNVNPNFGRNPFTDRFNGTIPGLLNLKIVNRPCPRRTLGGTECFGAEDSAGKMYVVKYVNMESPDSPESVKASVRHELLLWNSFLTDKVALIRSFEERGPEKFFIFDKERRNLGQCLKEGMDMSNCIRRMVVPILEGIHFFHSYNYVIGNIEPFNIVETDGLFQLTEFSHILTEGEWNSTSVTRKPSVYRSPEYMKGQAVNRTHDIFSFATVMYHVLYGAEPFCGYREVTTLQLRETQWTDENFSKFFLTIVNSPQGTRPNILQVMTHPWVNENAPPSLN